MCGRLERNTREKREGVYCKLLCVCKLLVLVIKQCVLSPLSVSRPPPVVSPTNTLDFKIIGQRETLKLLLITIANT
jgi:hypothetical protein